MISKQQHCTEFCLLLPEECWWKLASCKAWLPLAHRRHPLFSMYRSQEWGTAYTWSRVCDKNCLRALIPHNGLVVRQFDFKKTQSPTPQTKVFRAMLALWKVLFWFLAIDSVKLHDLAPSYRRGRGRILLAKYAKHLCDLCEMHPTRSGWRRSPGARKAQSFEWQREIEKAVNS